MVGLNYINLDADFFKEETREGFLITKKKKELWAIQMDILKLISQLCEKHGIRWFVHAGTLLGSARDGKMIPWDDDVDIMMTRNNYDKFIKVCREELEEPYCLTPMRNDRFLRIMRTDTMMYSSELIPCIVTAGIFVDVFPLDKIPVEGKEEHIEYLIWHKHRGDIEDFNKEAVKYNDYEGCVCREYSDTSMLSQNHKKDMIYKIEWFNDTVYLKLFNMDVPAPSGYMELLASKYGEDFMTPKQVNPIHSFQYFDTDNSYRCYHDIPKNDDMFLSNDMTMMMRKVKSLIYSGKKFIYDENDNTVYTPVMSRFEDITIWFSKLPGKYMKVIETVYVGNGMYGYNIKDNEGNIIKSEPGIYDYCHVRYKAVEAALLINLDI